MIDVAVVGAGVAGLSCARELARGGVRVTVVDRARGVGGRCATRRIQGQPVDHGVAFLHGVDPAFVDELKAVTDATFLEGWPERVEGLGVPCQPQAFAYNEHRIAYEEGVSAFPKHLAKGLDVKLVSRVTRLTAEGDDAIRALCDDDTSLVSRSVVLALAPGQTEALLAESARTETRLSSLLPLLGLVGTVPCLALIAGYGSDVPRPDWQIFYPDDSAVLHTVVHDSSKRRAPRFLVLVLQARPRWSLEWQDRSAGEWASAMLDEAAARIGSWVRNPTWTDSHVWRSARAAGEGGFTAPIVVRTSNGARIGLAGEIFAPVGGVEAAWLSGRALARRLCTEN